MRPSARYRTASGTAAPPAIAGSAETLPARTDGWFGQLPDRIVIFRRPIEARARSGADLAELVREVVIHEVAHYFGIDDDRLDELGW